MALEQSNSRQGFSRSGIRDCVQPLCWFLLDVPFPNALCPLGSWALVMGGLSQVNPKRRAAPPWSSLGHPDGSHTGRGGWLRCCFGLELSSGTLG